jgi:hypothetical protein
MASFGTHFAAANLDGERPSFTGITGPKTMFTDEPVEGPTFASEV